jgi:hypothetical protein
VLVRTIVRLCSPALSLFALACIAGCGSQSMMSPPQPQQPVNAAAKTEVIYAQNDLDPQIFAFHIDPQQGSLTPVSGSPFPVPVNVRRITASADGKLLLATRTNGVPPEPDGLYAFPIRADGALDTSQQLPTVAGLFVTAEEFQPNMFYMLGDPPDSISVQQYNPAQATFSSPLSSTSCASLAAGCVEIMGRSPDGKTLWTKTTTCPDGPFFSCTNAFPSFSVDAGGALVPHLGPSPASESVFDPVIFNSGVVFVAFHDLAGDPTVEAWSKDGKQLQVCAAADSAGCTHPWNVAADPQQRFLFVGTSDGLLATFPITHGPGFLPLQAPAPLATGLRPDEMIVNASGKFLYVLDSLSNTLSGFSIDQSTGALTPIPSATVNVAGPNAASNGLQFRSLAIAEIAATN